MAAPRRRRATPGSGPEPTPGNTTGLLEDSNRNDTQRNISAEFNYDLGFANLTFIPALRTSNDTYFGYEPGSPFSDLETVRETSYELRLAKNRTSSNGSEVCISSMIISPSTSMPSSALS